MSKNIKSPWTKLYREGVDKHLNYYNGSLSSYLEVAAKKYPNNVAYSYFGVKKTFKELISRIELTARALKKQGIKENDVVTICMPNTPQAIIMFYAVNMVGAIANMVHPLSSENEIEFYLSSSNSKMVLTIDLTYPKVMKVLDKTKVEKVIVTSAGDDFNVFTTFAYWMVKVKNKKQIIEDSKTITWRVFYDLGRTYRGSYRVKRKAKDLAVILYSGGTTGNPKGIALSNINFNALALQCHLMCDPSKAGDSVLAIMPIFHGFGIGVCIHTPLCAGMSVILIPQFKAKEFNRLINKYQPNFLAGVPTLFEALIKDEEMTSDALKCVTCVVSGGDTLSLDLKKKTEQFLKDHGSSAVIRVGYGLTECVGATCLTPSNYYKDGSIGIPLPDMYYKIVKIGTCDELPYDEDGEICITGPTVMMGYYNDKEETKKVLKRHKDGKIWLHTGDIASMDKEGLIYFKQRLKRIIISSGYNIYPTYIEDVLRKHPMINNAVVIGIQHDYKGEVGKAYIILKEGIEATDKIKNDIKLYCKQNIAKYAIPYEFEYRHELPKTLVGKIAYGKLKEEKKELQK